MRLGPFAAMAVGTALFLGLATSSSGQSPSGRASKSVLPPLKEDARDPAATQSLLPASAQAREQLMDLADDLKLAPAQRAAWAAYSTRVQQLADDVARNRNALRFPKGTAPEQLEFVAETLRNRLTALEDITDAGKALYAVLTPDQRAVADNRLARVSIPFIAPIQPLSGGEAKGRPSGDAPPGARGH